MLALVTVAVLEVVWSSADEVLAVATKATDASSCQLQLRAQLWPKFPPEGLFKRCFESRITQ